MTCPTLESGNGTVVCNTSLSPVTCTYTCPTGQYYESGGILLHNKTITCNNDTAKWSHMTATNPLGTLPHCTVKPTPLYYLMRALVGFTGSTSCLDISQTRVAVWNYFVGSSSAAYSCAKGGTPDCAVTDVNCSSKSTGIQLSFIVNQTKGDLTSTTAITEFSIQLETDAKAKTLIISVASSKRAATLLTADGAVTSAVTAACPAGAGIVGTSCVECPAGQYETGGVCQDCPVDQYSDTAGSTSCTSCPDSTKTITTGQSSLNDCTTTCTVESASNGIRSPSVGYTVSYDTVVTIFCNTNYSLEYNTKDTAQCDAVQPNCYQRCSIATISGSVRVSPVVVEDMLLYNEDVEYECPLNKIQTVTCSIAGSRLNLYCDQSNVILLLAIIVGGSVVLTVLIVCCYFMCCAGNKKKDTEPAPPEAIEPMLHEHENQVIVMSKFPNDTRKQKDEEGVRN